MEALTVSPFHIPRLTISVEECGIAVDEGVYLSDPIEASFHYLAEEARPIVAKGISFDEVLYRLRRQAARAFLDEGFEWPGWLWDIAAEGDIARLFSLVAKWRERERPRHYECHIVLMKMDDGSFRLSLFADGIREQFRHHGGWYDAARFEKRSSDLGELFDAMERVLRQWERNFFWRWWYHLRHPISWDE